MISISLHVWTGPGPSAAEDVLAGKVWQYYGDPLLEGCHEGIGCSCQNGENAVVISKRLTFLLQICFEDLDP